MRDSAHGNAHGTGALGAGSIIARRRLAFAVPTAAACLLAFGTAAASASGAHQRHARSHAARSNRRHNSRSASSSMYIRESAKLNRVGKARGFDLNEKGYVSGTIKGSIYLQLHVTSTKSVTATVKVYPHGGSLTGSGSGSYGVRGANASFAGSLSITGGSGSFKGAHGSGLRFSGSIKRGNDQMTVELSGRFSR